jgi:hypothetical protein
MAQNPQHSLSTSQLGYEALQCCLASNETDLDELLPQSASLLGGGGECKVFLTFAVQHVTYNTQLWPGGNKIYNGQQQAGFQKHLSSWSLQLYIN